MLQDIAPQAKLEKHWAPTLGSVAGFLLGVVGHMMVGSLMAFFSLIRVVEKDGAISRR